LAFLPTSLRSSLRGASVPFSPRAHAHGLQPRPRSAVASPLPALHWPVGSALAAPRWPRPPGPSGASFCPVVFHAALHCCRGPSIWPYGRTAFLSFLRLRLCTSRLSRVLRPQSHAFLFFSVAEASAPSPRLGSSSQGLWSFRDLMWTAPCCDVHHAY